MCPPLTRTAPAPLPAQGLGGADQIIGGLHAQAGEAGGFGRIRRDQGCEREEQRLHRLDAAVVDKVRTAFGDHHRVDDERDVGVWRKRLGDGFHRAGRNEHPRLHRVGADIVEHDADLIGDGLRRYGVERMNTGGVLHGDRGDRRHGVGAECGRGLDVGLDSGAAA